MLHPASSIDSSCEYAAKLIPISVAQERCSFSRTDFYRFREKHKIGMQPGRRVMVDDIVEAFEAERAGHKRDPQTSGSTGMPQFEAYLRKLLPLMHAAQIYGFSEVSFWRFRRAHGINKLSGQVVHEDDLIAAFEAQRKGTSLKAVRAAAAFGRENVQKPSTPAKERTTSSN